MDDFHEFLNAVSDDPIIGNFGFQKTFQFLELQAIRTMLYFVFGQNWNLDEWERV